MRNNLAPLGGRIESYFKTKILSPVSTPHPAPTQMSTTSPIADESTRTKEDLGQLFHQQPNMGELSCNTTPKLNFWQHSPHIKSPVTHSAGDVARKTSHETIISPNTSSSPPAQQTLDNFFSYHFSEKPQGHGANAAPNIDNFSNTSKNSKPLKRRKRKTQEKTHNQTLVNDSSNST